MYEPNSGAIYFGGENVKKFNLSSWRRAFVSVAQGSPIMEGTIRSNMTYGYEREASDAELTRVAKLAGIYDLIQTLANV